MPFDGPKIRCSRADIVETMSIWSMVAVFNGDGFSNLVKICDAPLEAMVTTKVVPGRQMAIYDC